MKIKLLISLGYVNGYPDTKRGDIIDIDDFNAMNYCQSGYAVPVRGSAGPTVERAVAPQAEKAVIDVPPSSIPPHPADTKVEPKVEEPKEKPKPLDDESAAARPAPAPRPQGRPGQRR
jgi:hypothetical protein